MPGLMGIVTHGPGLRTRSDLTHVLAATDDVSRSPFAEIRDDARGHFAVAATAVLRKPTIGEAAGVTALLYGTIDNLVELHTVVNPPHESVAAGDLVAAAYRSVGIRCFSNLEGAYSAVIVDEQDRTVALVSDVLGTFPIYWTADDERLAFGPSLIGLVRGLRRRPSLDFRAVADYVHFGFVLGTKTLAGDVTLVPPGTALVYSWRDGSLKTVVHQRAADLFARRDEPQSNYCDSIREEFNAAVRRASSTDQQLGLSLSGGLDSRAVLSAIDTRLTSLATCTVGARLCADHLIARQLSRLTRTRHRFLEIGDGYLRDFIPNLERMVALTDGMYLSHGLTEMLALKGIEESGIRVLLRGHGGELAKTSLAWPLHTDARVFAMNGSDTLASYLFARLNYVSGDLSVDELFSDVCDERLPAMAKHSLSAAVHDVALAPAELCSYLYLTEHHRRFTVPSLKVFRTRTDVRLPFADQRFLRTLLGGRPEWRTGTEVHRHIMARNNRRLLWVRNSNTGAPAAAGPLVERLFDPINTVLKRINAPGYRHYHRYDVWLRQQLLASVDAILRDDRTLRRGVYRTAALDALVEATRNGSTKTAYLLQILLVLELWQRQVEAA